MSAKGGGFAARFVTAVIILAVLFTLIWVPGLSMSLALFVTILAGIGLHEYYAMARATHMEPETIAGLLAGACVTLSGFFFGPEVTSAVLYAACAFVMGVLVLRARLSTAAFASSVFGIVYVGWFPAHIGFLHQVPDFGPGLVTVLIAGVALTDTAAYFVGKGFGKHKMAPIISPNKTWEGAAGGFVVTVLVLALFYYLRQHIGWNALPDWSLARYLLAGAALSLVAQVGDLAESSMKRAAGVKDSGSAFPGHGGVLDRCDGILFAAPVLYYIHTY